MGGRGEVGDAAGPAAGEGTRPASARGHRSAALAVVLTWLVPGLGHFYLGRRHRALLFGAIVVFMFCVGLLLEGSLSRPVPGSYLSSLATLADLGAGPVNLLARAVGWGVGRPEAATHEIGNTFHWTAGIMNMLLMLDASDVAHGRK